MKALDVAELPEYGFGHRSLLWWGTMCMMAIEGTMFALVIATYIYLKGRSPHWPPAVAPPRLLWGTLNVIILLASCVPNQLAKKAAEKFDLAGTQLWMAACMVFALAFNVVRFLEFGALNVRWDTTAYGSVVWLNMGLHTTHLITDAADTVVLLVLMFREPIKGKNYSDVYDNGAYWYFVVLAWLPIYFVIYWAPRIH